MTDEASSAIPVALYSKPGCHLCEEARALLTPLVEQGKLIIRPVDINSSLDLQRQFQFRIPVLQFPDDRMLDWPFTVLDVERALVASP